MRGSALRPRPRPSTGGFTLLEVLVATIIMAVAISGLLAALTTAMNNAGRLTDHDRAITLARQQMNDLLVADTAPRDTPIGGVWDRAFTAGRPCGWTGMITIFEVPPHPAKGDAALDRIHLEVWCGEGDEKRTFTLEGFRAGSVSLAEAKQRETP